MKEIYSRQFPEVPEANLKHGFASFEMREWGAAESGKVRENWVIDHKGELLRVMVTTDRVSVSDKVVASVPGVGRVRNLLAAFWFEVMQDIVPDHMVATPHSNVMVARQADTTLGVEMVMRSHMARSNTGTSVSRNYREGRRNIYGIEFPEGLQENRPFPSYLGYDGVVFTPTTKAAKGEHDQELTEFKAREIVDSTCGSGVWEQAKQGCLAMYKRASSRLEESGLILADTKIELGMIDGKLAVIDELFTPDSSRIWLAETYIERLEKGDNPDNFDKQTLRDELDRLGFRGDGPVPALSAEVIERVSLTYEELLHRIVGNYVTLPSEPATASSIRRSLAEYFGLAA